MTALRPERRRGFADLSPGAGRTRASRPVWFDPAGAADCHIHPRALLAPGERLAGPAIIEETDSTTVLHPGDRLAVGKAGLLEIELGRAP